MVLEAVFRIFLPAYLIAFLYILYYHGISSFKKKYNANPLVVSEENTIQYWLEKVKKVMFLTVFSSTLFFYSIFNSLYWILHPITYLNSWIIRFTGMAFLLLSIILIKIAQNQLKSSWSIGTSMNTKTELVTDGIYAISRNPIAVGLRMSLVGMFMALPNTITFTVMVVGFLTGGIRIIIEEKHLNQKLGEKYQSYRKKTPKWI